MRLAVFAAVGVQISYLSGALHKSNLGLERRVCQRTAELDFQKTLLESQIEASLDGILAASAAGEVLFANRRFREVWGLGAAEAKGTLSDLRRTMRAKLAEPVDLLSDGAAGESGPVIGDGSDQVVLADGRVVERYSAPVVGGDGTSYGRVWFFRDVTDRMRLEKEILEAGERERQRIGQDLHDDLCQQLTGIACLTRVMQQRLSGRSADEAGDAGTIRDLVQQAIACCRGLSKGLQPVTLEADGLVAALRELCSRVEPLFGVPCRFRGDAGTVAFGDAAVPTHLYRIAQEAITNAVKHARAKRIGVDLVAAGERLVLAVEDDGVGIPEVLPAEGLGLQTMRHRARMIGATLAIEREPGGGTTVTCSVRNPAATRAANPEADRAHA
jgi:PAS domain S-box-containing protein